MEQIKHHTQMYR